MFWLAGAEDRKKAQVDGRQDVWGLLVHSLFPPKRNAWKASDGEGQVRRMVSREA